MKRKLGPCLACVILLGFSSGCLDVVLGLETVRGSGRISEESHRFTGLTGVELATRGRMEIHLGDTEALLVSADENLHEYFEITTDGGTLRIGVRPGFHLRPSGRIRYTLTVREIEFIGLSSSGDASAPALRADRFEIRLDSSGDLSVDAIEADAVDVRLGSSGDLSIDAVQADAVDVRLGSSGDLSVDDLRAGSLAVRIGSSGDVRIGGGEVDSLDLTINSSGDYRGESVRGTRATVALSSSGDARLWAEESLGAKLTSSGSVSYRGDPEVVESTSSSGRVRRIR
jgi:hypothetical protein